MLRARRVSCNRQTKRGGYGDEKGRTERAKEDGVDDGGQEGRETMQSNLFCFAVNEMGLG